MKRTSVYAIAAAVLASLTAMPLIAQHKNDADKAVAGGTLPAGWKGRLDSGGPVAGVKLMLMGTALHFVTGPAGIYFKSADKPATGAYEAHAMFTQLALAAHPEAYGLIIGGSDLEGAGQKYTYFIIRQDGMFMVKRRAGNDTPTIMDWTESAAIKRPDASGKMANGLAIDVGKDKVRFLVNGAEVGSTGASKLDVAGIVGIRVNHNLSLMVDGFGVKSH
jgi:hypothetical protein